MSSSHRAILVLFAHRALQKSHVNRRLIREPQQMEGVYFHDLYEAYPRFDIDVPHEQQLLTDHDVIALQHPLYWYSTPAILKEWQDLVLQHGWAYGAKDTALHGKRWHQVVTAGGSEEAYCAQGSNRLTVRQLLAPLEQTARLCGMRFLPLSLRKTPSVNLRWTYTMPIPTGSADLRSHLPPDTPISDPLVS